MDFLLCHAYHSVPAWRRDRLVHYIFPSEPFFSTRVWIYVLFIFLSDAMYFIHNMSYSFNAILTRRIYVPKGGIHIYTLVWLSIKPTKISRQPYTDDILWSRHWQWLGQMGRLQNVSSSWKIQSGIPSQMLSCAIHIDELRHLNLPEHVLFKQCSSWPPGQFHIPLQTCLIGIQ